MKDRDPHAQRVLIVCDSDPLMDPRPERLISWLSNRFQVDSFSPSQRSDHRIAHFILKSRLLSPLRKVIRLASLMIGAYSIYIKSLDWCPWERRLRGKYDFVVCFDVHLLPLSIAIANGGSCVFDAREYYTRQFEHDPKWKKYVAPLYDWILRKYIKRCTRFYTVGPEIAKMYEKEYGRRPDVLMSLPAFQDLSPSPVGSTIRLIHHGLASRPRRIEAMVKAFVDTGRGDMSLSLMLVETDKEYYRELVSIVSSCERVKIVPPVPYSEIVPCLNGYDVGVFLSSAETFNLTYCLPNKLFEFIQARLMVIVGPGPEMANIVKRYKVGEVCEDFSSEGLTAVLKSVTKEGVAARKAASAKAARELSMETSAAYWATIFTKGGSDARCI